MKYILILAFSCLVYSVKGQQVSSIYNPKNPVFIPDKDTIPVMILYCDTSHFDSFATFTPFQYTERILSGKDSLETKSIGKMKGQFSMVLWMRGFVSRHKENYGTSQYMQIDRYLDENKYPLSKSIYVWMSVLVK